MELFTVPHKLKAKFYSSRSRSSGFPCNENSLIEVECRNKLGIELHIKNEKHGQQDQNMIVSSGEVQDRQRSGNRVMWSKIFEKR